MMAHSSSPRQGLRHHSSVPIPLALLEGLRKRPRRRRRTREGRQMLVRGSHCGRSARSQPSEDEIMDPKRRDERREVVEAGLGEVEANLRCGSKKISK